MSFYEKLRNLWEKKHFSQNEFQGMKAEQEMDLPPKSPQMISPGFQSEMFYKYSLDVWIFGE